MTDAFTYVRHPRVYRTGVTFDIQSDWAEFNLLSHSAVIIPDGANPFPEKTVISNTRVKWGSEYSYQFERKTLRLYVVNDGSPIDFSISHGTDGAGRGTGNGRAEVILEGNNYLNDKITDRVWNTAWFHKVPVSTVPVATNLDLTHARGWEEVLKLYLEDIGAIKKV